MQYSERAARNSRSTRNRHNGHINAFKANVMKTGNGFEDSRGTHYAEAIVAQRKVKVPGQEAPVIVPSITRVRIG